MAMQNQTSLGREIQILCNRLGFSPAPADLISSRQKLLKKYAQYR